MDTSAIVTLSAISKNGRESTTTRRAVCFWHKADIAVAANDAAFGGKADYGSLDDPQSQPPAGTSVAAQNVSVPFVGSIFQIAGYGAALWWAKGESAAGPGGIEPTLFTALEHSIESKLIGIS